jgi:hypothetical protein
VSRPDADGILVKEILIAPRLLVEQENWGEMQNFALVITWRGVQEDEGDRARGGYGVQGGQFKWLSRTGKWASYVEPYQQWQYRWATIEEAMKVALEHRDDIRVNGKTYSEWYGNMNQEQSNG